MLIIFNFLKKINKKFNFKKKPGSGGSPAKFKKNNKKNNLKTTLLFWLPMLLKCRFPETFIKVKNKKRGAI